MPGEQRNDEPWRVGRSYGQHVYAVGPTSPDGDRPVATFHDAGDAAAAVEAHNTLTAVRVELQEARDEAAATNSAYQAAQARWAKDHAHWSANGGGPDALAAARRTLDEIRRNATLEINDAKEGEAYAAEINSGGALMAAQARRFAWEAVARLLAASSPDTDTRNGQCGDEATAGGGGEGLLICVKPAGHLDWHGNGVGDLWNYDQADTRNEGERHG